MKAILGIALLAGLALSPSLWTSDRAFPLVPVIDGLPKLPPRLCLGIVGIWVAAIIAAAVWPRPGRWILAVPALAGVLVLFDQNRLQPWVYQYALMFAALAMVDWRRPDAPGTRAAWAVCGLIVASIYFWSGLQKANASFGANVYPWLLEPLRKVLEPEAVDAIQRAAWAPPVLECLIGASLVFPRTRLLGLIGLTFMHLSILMVLGPWGHDFNSVVWPWNLAMIGLAWALFFRSRDPLFRFAWPSRLGKAVILLVCVLPGLSFFNLWDDYLSASLYSGRMRYPRIALEGEDIERFAKAYGVEPHYFYTPEAVAFYQTDIGHFDLDVLQWSYDVLNVPPYPEIRYMKGLARELRSAGIAEERIALYVSRRPILSGVLDEEERVPLR